MARRSLIKNLIIKSDKIIFLVPTCVSLVKSATKKPCRQCIEDTYEKQQMEQFVAKNSHFVSKCRADNRERYWDVGKISDIAAKTLLSYLRYLFFPNIDFIFTDSADVLDLIPFNMLTEKQGKKRRG